MKVFVLFDGIYEPELIAIYLKKENAEKHLDTIVKEHVPYYLKDKENTSWILRRLDEQNPPPPTYENYYKALAKDYEIEEIETGD